jgi:Spy/CpxP family protein refolding chaperone
MKCRTWFLSAALLLVIAVAPVLAADAPAAAKAPEAKKAAAPAAPKTEGAPAAAAPAKPAVDGDLAVMVRECKLTDEQVVKLTEAASAIMVQLGDWQKTNADKLAGFQKAFEAAQTAKDEAAMAKVRTDAMPVMQERMTLIMKGQKGMMDILSPEQRSTWLGYITFRQLMAGMSAVDLTTEQLAKIRELCNTAGKELDGVKDEGEAGMAALVKIRTTMLDNIRAKILTPEQRAKMPPNPTVPPAGATPPAAPKAPETKAPETKAPATK